MTGERPLNSNAPTVHCPDCGTRYRWRDDFAGKELHCRCGCVFTPVAPPEVAAGAAQAAQKPKLPFGSPTSSIQQALDAGEFAAEPTTFIDKTLPIVLLAAGVPLGALVTWFITGKPVLFVLCLLGLLLFEAIVAVPVMIGSLWWMANTFGEAFGRLNEVVFKVVSVTLGSGLIADAVFAYFMTNVHVLAGDWPTLYVGAFGGGFAIYFILQGLPIWAMFRVHPAMIAGVIACNYLLRFGIFFAAFYAVRPFWP